MLIYRSLLIFRDFTDTCGRVTHSIPNTGYIITHCTYYKAQKLRKIAQIKQTLHRQTFYELIIMNTVLSLSIHAVLPLSRKAEMSLSPIQFSGTKEMNSTLQSKNIFLLISDILKKCLNHYKIIQTFQFLYDTQAKIGWYLEKHPLMAHK